MAEEQTQHRTPTSARLRFVLGPAAADITVPAEVALVDLLPAVLPQFGAEVVEDGADHEGWIVQRLGEPPLEEDRTAAELALHDGETLHLRPRSDQLTPIDYDDVVDGVGEQVRSHPGAWTPARTRVLLQVGAVAALLLGAVLLLADGPGQVGLVVCVTVTAALLGASLLVARGAADPLVATLLAGVASVYAGLTGALTMLVLDPVATPAMVLAATAAGALTGLSVGLVAVADAALLFAGAVTWWGTLVLAGLVGSIFAVTLAQAAAIALTLTLVIGIFVPSAAFRLSGLSLPLLPTTGEELTEDIEPVPHRLVVERGVATVGYTDALHVGLGGAQLVLLPPIALGNGPWDRAFVLVVAGLLLLRGRHPTGRIARWAVVVPAATAVALSLVEIVDGTGVIGRTAMCLAVFATGVLLLLLSRRLPGRRLRPYWGRAVDILESLTAVAVLPLLLQVLGVYAVMRGLAG